MVDFDAGALTWGVDVQRCSGVHGGCPAMNVPSKEDRTLRTSTRGGCAAGDKRKLAWKLPSGQPAALNIVRCEPLTPPTVRLPVPPYNRFPFIVRSSSRMKTPLCVFLHAQASMDMLVKETRLSTPAMPDSSLTLTVTSLATACS
jgi:hypothetical protein